MLTIWNRYGSIGRMKTITLKNIPEELHRTYQERARVHARSLNREILHTLEVAASRELPNREAALARSRERVARQVARRQVAGQAQLTTDTYLRAIREERE